jgi:hypothetical protein
MFILNHAHPEAGGRAEADHYPTPPVLARAGVEIAEDLLGEIRSVLEPGCGYWSPFLAASNPSEKRYGVDIGSIDNEEFDRLIGVDYLTDEECFYRAWSNRRWHLIITNPPFSLATEFVERSRELIADDGLVVMLLRLSIEGSVRRRKFWQNNPYLFRYVIRPRPSFVKGTSDNSEYGYFVWASPSTTDFMVRLGMPFGISRFVDSPLDKGWGKAE